MTSSRVIRGSIALFLLLVGLTGLFVYSQVAYYARARFWVAHTHAVIEQSQGLFTLVQAAESAERGFILTGEPAFRAAYARAAGEIPAAEAGLAHLVRDNPDQIARQRTLNALIARRLAVLAGAEDLASRGQMDAAREVVRNGGGPDAMADLDRTAAGITAAERTLLEKRTAAVSRANRLVLGVGLAVALLALIGLLGAVAYLERANRRLRSSMAEAAASRAALEASDALTRAIFANAPDYLIVLEIQEGDRFVVADINPAFERAINVRSERIRGRAVSDLLGGQAAAAAIEHYRRVRAAGRPVLTRDVIPGLPDGPRTWESILAPVKNAEGVTDRIIGAIRDITDRVRTEERLRDSQRMEAIGHLTGGVAHDFNNLLQVIRGNLELLESAVNERDRPRRQLANALHAADRAAQLTRQLLAFARRQPLEPEVINLARLLTDMADLLRRTLGETIEVEMIVGGGLWNTLADPAQVESAVLNLALNARDAMAEGGRLTVELANVFLDEAYVAEAEGVEAGQYVQIAVSDTGEGMSADARDRAFEPFFTTKGEGRGSGLGLSMVYGFVKQSGGHVRIYSEPGHGTTVRIYLPRSSRQVAAATPGPSEASAGASQTVLVVEDEETVRAAAIATLEELGYRCLEASDATSALEILGDGGGVDLVFTDVVMPGPLSTRDFAARVRSLAPDLPILFTSGYTENAIVHHGRLDEGVTLISKPYARGDLARKVAQILSPR